VNVGQTIDVGLNSPSLFLIARDLRKMEVWAAVGESDVGAVKEGQKATFTVDAFPGELFLGVVRQVRLNAVTTNKKVTYPVVISSDNPNGKLLPYRTAAVSIVVATRKDVLQAPSAALRWRPQMDEIVPEARAAFAKASPHTQFVWVEDKGLVRPIPV